MSIEFSEVIETINERADDIKDNAMLINELVVDDILYILGYNKKRDRNIKMCFGGAVDWEILTGVKSRIAVKVIAPYNEEEKLNTINYCINKRISILIITDGINISVYRFKKETLEYAEVININVLEELSEQDILILRAISKQEFDLNIIDNMLRTKTVTYDDITDIISNRIEDLNTIIKDWVKSEEPKAGNIENITEAYCIELLNKLKSKKTSFVSEDNEQKLLELSNNFKAAQDDYTKQIRELLDKLSERDTQIENLQKEITSYMDKIDILSGKTKAEALEMLELVNDNEEDNRTYACVINKELIHVGSLKGFVGRVLQKLFEIKNFDAETFIFDGDWFRIKQDDEATDMIINETPYCINVSDDNEDEVLDKLSELFKTSFKDIVFEYKKLGTLRKESTTTSEENNKIIDDNNSDSGVYIVNDKEEANTEEFLSSMENIEFEEVAEESDISDKDKEGNSHLLVILMRQIEQLFSLKNEIKFKSIKYIGTNNINFAISTECSNLNELFVDCLDAIIAIQTYNNDTDIVLKLKQNKSISQLSSFIHLPNDKNRSCPRISGTTLVVDGISTIEEIVNTLITICRELSISTDEIFMYLECETDSEYVINNYSFPEQSIQMLCNTEYTKKDKINSRIAVVKGDMFNYTLITSNSSIAHKNIFNKVLAVKTKYMSKEIKGKPEIIDTIKSMIIEYAKSNDITNINYIGKLIGTDKRIISFDKENVTSDYSKIDINNNTVYVSNIEDWQVVYVLLKIHTSLFCNASIAIKVIVDADAINFYGSEFETFEPSLSISVNTLATYISKCIVK